VRILWSLTTSQWQTYTRLSPVVGVDDGAPSLGWPNLMLPTKDGQERESGSPRTGSVPTGRVAELASYIREA